MSFSCFTAFAVAAYVVSVLVKVSLSWTTPDADVDAAGNDCQVPFLERYFVVSEPSNAREVLATLLAADASVTTNLSPFAIVMSVV